MTVLRRSVRLFEIERSTQIHLVANLDVECTEVDADLSTLGMRYATL